jgi:hypothetical protein
VARDPKSSLMALTAPYVWTQAAGQAEDSVDATPWDLACCLQCAVTRSGHDDRRE